MPALFAPPGAFDALGAFGGDHLMQRAPPAEAQRRAVRHLGDGLDRLRLRQQPQGARRQLNVSAEAAERRPSQWRPSSAPAGCTAAISGIWLSCAIGRRTRAAPSRALSRSTSRSMSAASSAPPKPTCSGGSRLGDHHRQPRHVEAEAGIEFVGERGEPLGKQRADVACIAQGSRACRRRCGAARRRCGTGSVRCGGRRRRAAPARLSAGRRGARRCRARPPRARSARRNAARRRKAQPAAAD